MMMDLIFVGCTFLVVAVHPFVTYPLSLVLAYCLGVRAPIACAPVPARPPRFSLLVCAHNEEVVAEALALNRIRVARGHDCEILIYDDHSSDRTAHILERFDEVTLVRGKTRHGKTFGMNVLAARARGDVLVFSDANVELAEDVLHKLAPYFEDASVGCVCGHLTYVNDDESATAATGGLYWRLEERVKALESATGSTMGADGSIFAVRRELHRSVPERFIDDMYVSLSILMAGYRVVRAADVRAFERSATRPWDEFKRKARIACQALNVHRALRQRLSGLSPFDQYKYVSHKLLRWMSPFTGLLGLAFVTVGVAAGLGDPWARAAVSLPLSAGCFFLACRPKLVKALGSIALAFAGVGLGVAQSLRGELYQTWTPAASVR